MKPQKIITVLLLVPVTGAYAYLTVMLGYEATFPWGFNLLSVLSIFGLLGLIGVWLLFLNDTFDRRWLKRLTLVLLTFGFIAALSVSFIILKVSDFGRETDFPISLLIPWGLVILMVVVAFYGKKKLFNTPSHNA